MVSYVERLFSLAGQTAVITGAAGHLCGCMAAGIAQAGANVVLFDRDADAVSRGVAAIQSNGGRAIGAVGDVRDRTVHERALAEALAKFGSVDTLINGAGINAPTPFLEITEDEWNKIIGVHLTGTLLGCQVFGAQMLQQGRGSIMNMSSASSGPPLSRAFTYSVAKSGVKNLTQNLAREWVHQGVRVNALRPGFFPTEWSREHFIDEDRGRAILGHTPMGRYGEPEELLGAVIWLASPAASFVTGAEIQVDGGFTCMTI